MDSAERNDPILELTDITKQYGVTKALAGVSMKIRRGEIVGVIGHNGAGKSTLMRVIVGLTRPDSGSICFGGQSVGPKYSMQAGRALGVRMAFQELSLAPSLRVFENVLLNGASVAGWGWRRRSQKRICAALDEIYPGHGIFARHRVEELSLAQQQMLEVAQAVLDAEAHASLLILDEPSSALSKDQAENLFRHLKKLRDRGISTLLISHKLHEILGNTDRTVVMRDGRVVSEQATSELDHDRIVTIMGGVVKQKSGAGNQQNPRAQDTEVLLSTKNIHDANLRDAAVTVRAGEIVGLSGLDGQGQQQLLRYIWRNRRGAKGVRVSGGVSFVTGDRQTSGVFQLWSVGQNIGIGVLHELSSRGVINAAKEKALVAQWLGRLAVKGASKTPIVDLSGGNQQKALIARALASRSRVVLLDDPFRGVDIETKQQVYKLLREEAGKGRSFLWFTTESAELFECDRVYVMANGAVSAELSSGEISEEAMIAASFEKA